MAGTRLPAAVALLLLAACPRREPERLLVGVAHLPAFALVFIADAHGYFAAHGVKIEQRRFASGRDALAALRAGEVDAATCYTTPLSLRAATEDLDVLTMLHASVGLTRVVARADRGIARAEDLASSRIGVPLGTNAEYFLHTLLVSVGVAESAQVVDVAPAEAVDALSAGEVDAIATWPPYAERARLALPVGAAVEIRSDLHAEASVLVVRGATVRERRPALVRFVRALADAERLVREDPDRAFVAVRAEFPELSDADLREIWSEMRAALGVTHELASLLEREAAWFKAGGRSDGPPLDVRVVLDVGVLAEVDPQAVTFAAAARPQDPGEP